MVKIILKNGYYIEVDNFNYTLKQTYLGKDGKGNPKESSRTCGYFGKIEHAIERFLFLTQLDVMDGMTVDFKEYVELVDKSNKLAVQGLESVLSQFPSRC